MAKKKKYNKKNEKGFWNYIKKESSFKKINWKVFLISLVIVIAVAFIGGQFTDTGPWYDMIKPSITPPNWVFPVAWTVLFFLIAVAMYYSFIEIKKKSKTILFFAINLVLNILWSYVFFYLKNPLAGFIVIILLWLSILQLIVFNWKKSRTASYFLMPYLFWVSFASLLNFLMILR